MCKETQMRISQVHVTLQYYNMSQRGSRELDSKAAYILTEVANRVILNHCIQLSDKS